MSREEAQYLLDCQFAAWRARYCLILTKSLPLKLRGPSANIRESTILAALMGSSYHRSLIEAWQ